VYDCRYGVVNRPTSPATPAQPERALAGNSELTGVVANREKIKIGAPATSELVATDFGTYFLSFTDPTVRELPKSEEIVLPDIWFLTKDELDSLRANAEALKKKFEQTTR
jgi:hypothetical protein